MPKKAKVSKTALKEARKGESSISKFDVDNINQQIQEKDAGERAEEWYGITGTGI